ncbi:C40 family peptidase [Streptacidiphilus sp. MAP5-52]|uniref:C40 family peptidase n=1 Tax=Streptacidiphilus sp. MAP5-52 TaxID=3156267 RepID=UPI003511171C
MSGKIAAAAGALLLVPAAIAFPILAVAANDAATAATCGSGSAGSVDVAAVLAQVKQILSGKSGPVAPVAGLDSPLTQIPNAKAIVATGIALGVPARGQVIALATALQESGLEDLSYGDRDSVGLFQQRPSQGWGTPAQLMDPVYASTAFYKALLRVPGWQQLPLTEAAQAVQRSGYPDAYAKWESLATALQQAVAKVLGQPLPTGSPGAAGSPAPVPVGACGSGPGGIDWGNIPPGSLPSGYQIPADAPAAVRAAIRYALGQLGTPYQWGGSCTAAHGPDPMGRCDCSSLVQQSYRAGGISLPRTTYDQVTQGTAVSVSALLPGDLLFTEPGPNGPGHVGMVIGEGLVVEAPHTGAVVRVSTLASWLPGVVAARRIVP